MKSVLVMITTYHRNKQVESLIKQIKKYQNDYNIKIVVWDDDPQNNLTFDSDVELHRYKINHGKQKFWEIWADMFNFCHQYESDFYLFLQDDNILCDNFFEKMFNVWDKLNRPISLSVLIDDNALRRGVSRWGNHKYKYYDDYVLSSWVECSFLAKRNFFEALDWRIIKVDKERWTRDPNLSSGVGEQFTKRLNKKSERMYHCAPSLVLLESIESVMNKEERKKTPLSVDVKKQRLMLKGKYCDDIIVNFTTWKKRDCAVYPMLKNLQQQTTKPNKIICWLSDDEYQGVVPNTLKKCLDEKLLTDIKWVPGNVFAHKRWEAIRQYPQCYNFFIDDDILYEPKYIEDLLAFTKKHKDGISYYINGAVDYEGCNIRSISIKGNENKMTHLSGFCCCPPNVLNDDIFKNIDLRDIYCPKCDDSWILSWLIKNKIPRYTMFDRREKRWENVPDTQDVAIWNENRRLINGVQTKVRNFANAIKIIGGEKEVRSIWPNFDIDKCASYKNNIANNSHQIQNDVSRKDVSICRSSYKSHSFQHKDDTPAIKNARIAEKRRIVEKKHLANRTMAASRKPKIY